MQPSNRFALPALFAVSCLVASGGVRAEELNCLSGLPLCAPPACPDDSIGPVGPEVLLMFVHAPGTLQGLGGGNNFAIRASKLTAVRLLPMGVRAGLRSRIATSVAGGTSETAPTRGVSSSGLEPQEGTTWKRLWVASGTRSSGGRAARWRCGSSCNL